MRLTNEPCMGVLDWGIGGMGFVREFRRRHPDTPLLYWSDTGATPYGKLPHDALRARLEAVVQRMAEAGAAQVVVACNAASTVVDELDVGIEVSGIIEHGVAAAVEYAAGRARRPTVGVVGGRRTVESEIYRRRLEAHGLGVRQSVAQPMSALVEAGRLVGEEIDAAIARVVAPLEQVDALLLACTHYPAVADRFAVALPGVALIDPVGRLADWVSDRWSLAASGAPSRFVTTGDAGAMRLAAQAAFGVTLAEITEMPAPS